MAKKKSTRKKPAPPEPVDARGAVKGGEYEVGDTVCLKSGWGPRMTVSSVGDSSVTCRWFGGCNDLKYGSFDKRIIRHCHPIEPYGR